MEVKHEVFAELDAATPGHAVLASNTSGLSITEIGDATNRPDKVVGFHFFWPASVMRLIEIVEGEETSQATLQAAANFAQAIRKTPVRCAECPGFVVNRILTADGVGDLALPGRDGRLARGARRLRHRAGRDADGPVPGRRHERPRHRREGRARHARRLRRPLLRPPSAWRSWSRAATSAPRPGRASMSTEQIDPKLADRFTLKAFVEACLVLEEGVAGDPRRRPRDDDGHRHDPRPVRARRPARARRRAGRARAGRGGLGRALRAAADPAPPRRPGPPGRQERPGLLPLPAARGGLRAGAGQARPPRRRRGPVARQPARQLALAGRDRRRSSAPGATSRAARGR